MALQVSMIILFAFCTTFDGTIDAAQTGSSGQLGVIYSMFQDTHVMMLLGFGFLYTLLHRYSWSGCVCFFASQGSGEVHRCLARNPVPAESP